ncbi:hypothetical protein V2J09_006024 [Rumex salicifolius]
MTNSFAERLGEGGYGAVYKGKLLDGCLVAVKLLKSSKGDGEGFMNEVLSIGGTNHVNIVTLLAFCRNGDKSALVYEFMENGSLEKTFGDVSHKSDVYSYGMMVLEVIGSRKNTNTHVDNSSEMYFPHWIYKELEHEEEEEEMEFDVVLNGNDKELKRKLIIVSLWCIQPIPSSRPSMSGVVKMLEADIETIEVPPKPFHSSPPKPELDSSWSSTMIS